MIRMLSFQAILFATILIPRCIIASNAIELYAGMPKGSMDAAVGGRFSLQIIPNWPVRPLMVIEQNNSYNYDTEAEGSIFLLTSSIYILANFEQTVIGDNIAAFASAGPGAHMLNSYSTSSSAIGKHGNTTSTIKGHVMFGLKYLRPGNSYYFLSTRGTFPGEYLFDTLCLGYGRYF